MSVDNNNNDNDEYSVSNVLNTNNNNTPFYSVRENLALTHPLLPHGSSFHVNIDITSPRTESLTLIKATSF